MKVEDVNKKIAIFSKYLIAQNQSSQRFFYKYSFFRTVVIFYFLHLFMMAKSYFL